MRCWVVGAELYLQGMGTFPEWVEARPIEKADAEEWAALLAEAQEADRIRSTSTRRT